MKGPFIVLCSKFSVCILAGDTTTAAVEMETNRELRAEETTKPVFSLTVTPSKKVFFLEKMLLRIFLGCLP